MEDRTGGKHAVGFAAASQSPSNEDDGANKGGRPNLQAHLVATAAYGRIFRCKSISMMSQGPTQRLPLGITEHSDGVFEH